MYDRKDHYYKRAKEEGYASRAAYKLIQIQQKFKILKKGNVILELGAAPGGWMQIAAQEIGPQGSIVGIDRLPLKIRLPKNALFFQKDIGDISEADLPKRCDVILSDLSPDLSGISFRDTYFSYELSLKVWAIAKKLLKTGGNLVMKIFPGEETDQLKRELKKSFTTLKTFIPSATRKTSSEVYLVALGKKDSND